MSHGADGAGHGGKRTGGVRKAEGVSGGVDGRQAGRAMIRLGDGTQIKILHEDRSVIAIDKPPGWFLGPQSWVHTDRNLQLAIESSLQERPYWVRSRNLRFLRYLHRLDAETTGILLLGRSPGAVESIARLFEDRRVEKRYWCVVRARPRDREWVCREPLEPDPAWHGRWRVSSTGKVSETRFRVLGQTGMLALVEARPVTGRTHQIRLHLVASGYSILGDSMYGRATPDEVARGMALRAVYLAYQDPFTNRDVEIRAPSGAFAKRFGVHAPILGAKAGPDDEGSSGDQG